MPALTYKRPRLLAVLHAIGWVTFREIVRDKILYNSVLCALLLLGAGYLASRLTFVRPERVVLDFGLAATSLSCSFIAILIGAPLLGKEFERRTVFVALSKPISRFSFLLGKFTGLAAVVCANWVILTATFLVILTSVGGQVHGTLAWGLILVLFQSLMVAVLALFFSTFSTTSLSAIITIGLFLVGNNISQIRLIATKTDSPLGKEVLNFFSYVFPNLEFFSLGTKVTYGLPVPIQYGLLSILYALVVIATVLALAGLLINRREI